MDSSFAESILGASDAGCYPIITLVLKNTYCNSTYLEIWRFLLGKAGVNVNADLFLAFLILGIDR